MLDNPSRSLPYGFHLILISFSYGHEEDSSRGFFVLPLSSSEPQGARTIPYLGSYYRIEMKGPGQGWVQRCRNEAQHLPFAQVSPKVSSILQVRTQLHRSLATRHYQLAGCPLLPPKQKASIFCVLRPTLSLYYLEGVTPQIVITKEGC